MPYRPAILMASALALFAGAASAEPAWHPKASFSHLVAPDAAYARYALWAVAKGHDYPAGAFCVDGKGAAVAVDGMAPAVFTLGVPKRSVTEFFVTQEEGDAKTPGKQVFLRGAVAKGKAKLDAPIQAADYQKATGAFVLDNPVTVNDKDDFNGLWFSRYVSRRYAPALDLPESPDGWMYEGWVMVGGVPLRTGKFRTGTDASDWDGYSGRSGASELITMGMPPMPGQDFITRLPRGVPTGPNLPNLGGATVLVTLENATLAGEETYPSPIRVFEGKVPTPAAHNVTYELVNVTGSQLPSATISL